MNEDDRTDVTETLTSLCDGDQQAASKLMPVVYDELRRLAAHYLAAEPKDHTLQPTALVHEAFMKLVKQDRVDWRGKSHFFAVGAQVMRRILVDHARHKGRQKRGGDRQRIELADHLQLVWQKDEDVVAIDDALTKLAELDPRQARIVELRFFGGLKVEEVAEVLGVSKRTVESEWTMVRAWLRREMAREDES